MPKKVDSEKRCKKLAEAVWQVVLRDGIEGVSIRKVAAEAGLSTGALRHYLETKEGLLVYAAQLVVDRLVERLERNMHSTNTRDLAGTALRAVLPLNAERRTEAQIYFAFASRSLIDPKIADKHDIAFGRIRRLCIYTSPMNLPPTGTSPLDWIPRLRPAAYTHSSMG